MLSTTLSVITLSAEHKKYRNYISRLLQRIQAAWHEEQRINQCELSSLLRDLSRFHYSCHERIMERYVIPTLRVASRVADNLIAQLDMISQASEAILMSIRKQSPAAQSPTPLTEVEASPEIQTALETYCVQMQSRLDLEEKELLPLTLHVLTKEEDWFSIAAQLLKKADMNQQNHPMTIDHPSLSRSHAQSMVKIV